LRPFGIRNFNEFFEKNIFIGKATLNGLQNFPVSNVTSTTVEMLQKNIYSFLTPLQKGDRLLVWCLFSMFWFGEWTHQTCCPFSIRSHHDIRLAVPSFCVLISIERTMDFMNSLMRSLVCWFWSDPGSVFESSKADFVDLSNSSPIFREHAAVQYVLFIYSFFVNGLKSNWEF
jgi:hypothetical protein